jgi:hypothetical protein
VCRSPRPARPELPSASTPAQGEPPTGARLATLPGGRGASPRWARREYGLLFALLANQPSAQEIDDEPALAVHDLEVMFLDKRLPVGWQTWKQSRLDWVKHTTALLISAGKAYQALARGR